MTDTSEIVAERFVDTSDAAFQRDAALYDVIRRHGFRPIKWQITPQEAASLAAHFATLFGYPKTLVDAEADQRECEAERHAPLFRAIKQSSRQ